MNIRVCILATFLLLFACLGNADEAQWSFEWDRRLPSLELTNISIEEDNLVDAWRNFIAAHLVRCVLAIPAVNVEGAFQFNQERCTVSDVLDALCETYDCEWKPDPDTGVIWLAPEGAIESLHLKEVVVVSEPLRWVPMYTGVLDRFFDQNKPHRQFLLQQPRTMGWFNSYDYPVDLPAGNHTVYTLLNLCLPWSPDMTFLISSEGGPIGRTHIQLVRIPLDTIQGGGEGASLFWQVETGAEANGAPDITQVIERMGSSNPRDRWIAQEYWRLALDFGKMPHYLGSEFRNETEIRAGFAYLMSSLLRGISIYFNTKEHKGAIQEALASQRFDSFPPDVKLRLIALALAGTREGGYREAHAQLTLLGSERGKLRRDPHLLDSHPDVVKAREEDTPMREALLKKLPPDVDKALAEDDFDLQVFLKLYPWIADYLRTKP